VSGFFRQKQQKNRAVFLLTAHRLPNIELTLFFNSGSFIENRRNGIWLPSPASQSPDNTVVGCLFSENGGETIKIHPEGELFQEANIFQ